MLKKIFILYVWVVLLAAVQVTARERNRSVQPRTLVVFFDGLRRDYITPRIMPNLYAFAKRGAYAEQHHSVFPTVTRVNASAFSTGSYPARDGLMGNMVFFPQINATWGISTWGAKKLNRISKATNGHLLTAITLGELLEAAGKCMMVFSSGSPGEALLQNHTISGGAIVNSSIILPASFKDSVMKAIGPVPPEKDPNILRHKWATDALIRFGLAVNGPAVSVIWFSDPDGAEHATGIGSKTTMAALKSIDQEFGRIVHAIKNKGLGNRYNIIVSTDHGFVTHVGKQKLQDLLINLLVKKGLKKARSSGDVVVAGGAIYIKHHDKDKIKKIVSVLQKQNFVGPLFTKSAKTDDLKGWVKGTISLRAVHWNHPTRSGDILVAAKWNNQKNQFGYKGTSYGGEAAGHGGLSPYEVHIILLAGGPGFKKHFKSTLPTSNVDITPTVLHLEGIPVPDKMDGRVLYELLNEQAPTGTPPTVKTQTEKTRVTRSWGSYQLVLHRSLLETVSYVDFAKAIQTFK